MIVTLDNSIDIDTLGMHKNQLPLEHCSNNCVYHRCTDPINHPYALEQLIIFPFSGPFT